MLRWAFREFSEEIEGGRGGEYEGEVGYGCAQGSAGRGRCGRGKGFWADAGSGFEGGEVLVYCPDPCFAWWVCREVVAEVEFLRSACEAVKACE